jgi:intracellular multiplication protein IcmE
MTDDHENEILETGDLDAEAGLEDFETGTKTSFADAWKTNPMVKIGVVLGGLAVIIGGVMLFGGDSKPLAPSAMITSGNQGLKEAPGNKVSEVYEKAVKEVNEANVEKAIKEGNSSLPVPIGPSRGKVEVEAAKESSEDPLERWRRIQEERLKKEQQAKVQAPPPPPAAVQKPVDPYEKDKSALSSSMQTQMQSILEAQGVKDLKSASVTTDDYVKKQIEDHNKEVATQQAAANPVPPASGVVQILIEAGKIEYAQLITEADSDVPGPILAELASGPLVGSRILGSFAVQNEYLTLNFNAIVIDGVAVSINGIALDPATAKVGLVTDVDHKYFERIILPAAAAFIQGIGGAIADSGSTTVSAGQGTTTTAQNPLDAKKEFFKGVEKASDKVGEIVDADGQAAKVRIRVATGTHIGVLFMKEVTKGGDTQTTTAASSAPTTPQAQQLFLQLAPAVLQQAAQTQPGSIAGTGK